MGSEKKFKSEKGFEIKSVPNSHKKGRKTKKYLGKQYYENHFDKAFDKMEDNDTRFHTIENNNVKVIRKKLDGKFSLTFCILI